MNKPEHKFSTLFVAALMIMSGLAVISVVSQEASAHVPEGVGESLQLYSHQTTTPPIIDGEVNPDTDPLEWADAYVREIVLTDGEGLDINAFLLLMNDNDYLYLSLSYRGQNYGGNNWVEFYFDEGNEPVGDAYDGDHYNGDQSLETNNENMIRSPLGAAEDYFWNGSSGAWELDDTQDMNYGVGTDMMNTPGGSGYYTWETRVPLNNANIDAMDDSDLDVLPTDEIGFCLRVGIALVGNGTLWWDYTGDAYLDSTTSTWADILLGVPTSNRDLYTTWARDGSPTVDGDIADDIRWEGAWSKEIILTDFAGNNLESRVYFIEDPTNGIIYMGMAIYDDTYDTNDYLVLYQERGAGGGPLDGVIDGPDENAMYISGDGTTYEDRYADDLGDTIDWTADDTLVPDDKDGAGVAGYVIDGVNSHWEFEMAIPCDLPLIFGDADYDNDFASGDQIQFLIRFNQGGTDYFWDATTNVDDLAIDDSDGITNAAMGWAYLQTGGPYMNVITPGDGGSVSGSSYEVFVKSDVVADSTDWVGFKIEGDLTWKSLTGPSGAGTDEWKLNFDTTAYADGQRKIIFRAIEGGIDLRQEVVVNFANGGGGAPPTGVAMTGPVTGIYSGVMVIEATASGATSMEVLVDGILVGAMTPGAGNDYSYNLNTALFDDGTHIVQIKAGNSNGDSSDASSFSFDNQAPIVLVSSPIGAQYISGNFVFQAQAGVVYDLASVQFTFGENLSSLGVKDAFYNPATGFYEYPVDTTLYDDGAGTVMATATDQTGNVATSGAAIDFNIDNTDPFILIFTPVNGAVVSGASVSIEVLANEVFMLAYPMYNIDGGLWILIDDVIADPSYTENWDSTLHADGAHILNTQVIDLSGRITQTSIDIIINNVAPTVAQVAPGATETIEGTYVFSATADDILGVDRGEFAFGGTMVGLGTVVAAYNPGTGLYEYAVDSTLFADGASSVTPTSFDEGGLSTVGAIVNFNIDNTDPTLQIISPLDGASIKGNAYLLEVNADDSAGLAGVEYRIDGGAWVAVDDAIAAPLYQEDLDTTVIADGTHLLEFRATDNNGRAVTGERTVYVDNSDPEMPVISTPADGGYVSGIYTFLIDANDPGGIALVTINVTNGTGTVVLDNEQMGGGSYLYVLDTTLLADGVYSVFYTIHDEAGNSLSTTPRGFSIDNTEPILGIIMPQDGAVLDGYVNLKFTTLEASLLTVEYQVDSGAWTFISDITTPHDLVWDSASVGDGAHTLSFRATDMLGRRATASVSVLVDNLDPTAQVSSPAAGQVLSGVALVSGCAQDLGGLVSVEVRNDTSGTYAKAALDPITGCFEFSFDTTAMADGAHVLDLRLTDAIRSVNGPSIGYIIDNTAPGVSITAPTQGSLVFGNLNLIATISELQLASVSFRVNSGPWSALPNAGPYQTTIDTTALSDGAHTASIWVVDMAGHESIGSIGFVVDNVAPVVEIASPIDGQLLNGINTFGVHIDEAVDILDAYITLDSVQYKLAQTNGAWETTLDTSMLTDGSHTLTATALDGVRQTTTGSISLDVDNTSPILSLLSPLDGEVLSGEEIPIDFYVLEPAFTPVVQFRVDSENWTLLVQGDTINHTLNTTLYPDGNHLLTIMATDGAGQTSVVVREFRVDNTQPEVWMHAPATDEIIVPDGLYIIRATASDIVGIEAVWVEVDGTANLMELNTVLGYYEAIIDPIMLADGTHTAQVYARDLAGMEISGAVVDFQIDGKNPFMSLTEPLMDEVVLEDSLQITLDASNLDGVAPVDGELNAKHSLDGSNYVELAFSGDDQNYQAILDTTLLGDGVHVLEIVVEDDARHVSLSRMSFFLDRTDPVLNVVRPVRSGTTLTNDAVFQAFASDIAGITLAELSVDDVVVSELSLDDENGFYQVHLADLLLLDGEHKLEVRAIDGSGRETISSTVVLMDNSGPVATLIGPSETAKQTDTVVISANVADVSGIVQVLVRIDDGEWLPLKESDGTYSFKWATTAQDNGEHIYQIMATDSLGNSRTTVYTVVVENMDWLPIIALLIVVALVVILLAFVIVRKKKSKAMDEEARIKELGETPEGCNACLGTIHEHETEVACICGKVYHQRCANATEECPNCGATLKTDLGVSSDEPMDDESLDNVETDDEETDGADTSGVFGGGVDDAGISDADTDDTLTEDLTEEDDGDDEEKVEDKSSKGFSFGWGKKAEPEIDTDVEGTDLEDTTEDDSNLEEENPTSEDEPPAPDENNSGEESSELDAVSDVAPENNSRNDQSNQNVEPTNEPDTEVADPSDGTTTIGDDPEPGITEPWNSASGMNDPRLDKTKEPDNKKMDFGKPLIDLDEN